MMSYLKRQPETEGTFLTVKVTKGTDTDPMCEVARGVRLIVPHHCLTKVGIAGAVALHCGEAKQGAGER